MNRVKPDIRKMNINELDIIFKRIVTDFPEGEYAPLEVLKAQFEVCAQQGWVLEVENEIIAYSICAAGSETKYVLLSLLAVDNKVRNQGIGSLFLDILKEIYSDKGGILVEVEDPQDAEIAAEIASRNKRIEFYNRSGYQLIPDVDYSIWDVKMKLMALPIQTEFKKISDDVIEVMNAIYLKLMGEKFIHKLEISRSSH